MASQTIKVKLSETQTVKIKISQGLGHGNSASIKDHADVSSNNPINGQVLKYNDSEKKYIPSPDADKQFDWDGDFECWI